MTKIHTKLVLLRNKSLKARMNPITNLPFLVLYSSLIFSHPFHDKTTVFFLAYFDLRLRPWFRYKTGEAASRRETLALDDARGWAQSQLALVPERYSPIVLEGLGLAR